MSTGRGDRIFVIGEYFQVFWVVNKSKENLNLLRQLGNALLPLKKKKKKKKVGHRLLDHHSTMWQHDPQTGLRLC
jgi:hypothetical protein